MFKHKINQVDPMKNENNVPKIIEVPITVETNQDNAGINSVTKLQEKTLTHSTNQTLQKTETQREQELKVNYII